MPGLVDSLLQAGVAASFEKLTKQKLSILGEAERAGARILSAWEEGQYEHRSTSVRWQALTRGGLNVTSRQVYVLETSGIRHLYVQPFSADARLPGTHHLFVQGALRSPALYDTDRKAFYAGHDQELAMWLHSQPIHHALHQIDWDWRISGSTRAVDPIVFQIRPFQGVGHVAIRAFGPFGAFDSAGLDHHLVGFSKIGHIAHALVPSLGAVDADQPFQTPADGEEAFASLLLGQIELPVAAPPTDLSHPIGALLATANIGTLIKAPVPKKKDAGARKEILPTWLADQPILAMADATVFGGGGRGVVFTPTHVCVRTDEGRAAISYADIIGAGAMTGTLVVRSRMQGDFALNMSAPEAFAALFESVRPAPSVPPPSLPPPQHPV
jgi:hypothetical protein